MINVTRLYCGLEQPADALRYGQGHGAAPTSRGRQPIVVWTITRRCNLRCIHCYSDSEARPYPGELSYAECQAVVEDLARFGVPAVLLSGGEPLLHPRFFDLAAYARQKHLRLTLSTNGTLLDAQAARRIKDLGFAYVGISLDGIGERHDWFRGRRGAFDQAVQAFRHCKAVGQKVGLRLTLTAATIAELDRVLDFVEAEDIGRVCFYHLVYSGRGRAVVNVTHQQTRQAVDAIIDRAARWAAAGHPREVLTVDQPADGPYLYLRLVRENKLAQAQRAFQLLRWNGGGAHSSGTGLANIDSQGHVHPDQFWQDLSLGNVRQRPFSQIWTDTSHPLLAALRQAQRPLEGKCARCRFVPLCGGGFRVRAVQTYGRLWAPDPACYLTESEIAHPGRPASP